MLEADGYKVVTAATGEQALDLVYAGLRPCLILLGWTLLGTDRFTFRRFLTNARLAAIPVATYASPIKDEAEGLGGPRVGKRFDAREVLDLVNRRCRKS